MALSPKFQQTLVNSLAQQDRILHMAAKKVVDRMSSFAENAGTPSLRVALAVALQSKGGGSFDRQTRTKTVTHLLQVCFFLQWSCLLPVHASKVLTMSCVCEWHCKNSHV